MGKFVVRLGLLNYFIFEAKGAFSLNLYTCARPRACMSAKSVEKE